VSGDYEDVRIVPHGSGWAVKLTGGIGNKPVKVTDDLRLARAEAESVAARYQVPIVTFDAQGSFVSREAWKPKKPGKIRKE